LFLLLCSAASADHLYEPRHDSTILAAMDQIFRMDYAAADIALKRIPDNAAAKPYFSGIVCMNRFQDLGDTSALQRAEFFWTQLNAEKSGAFPNENGARLDTYHGLALMQLSYISSLRGERFHSAKLAFSAHSQFDGSNMAEARAGAALFEYYRGRLLSSIPLVEPNLNVPMQRLQVAADSSRYLRDLLRSSLFWMRVDHGEADSALRIPDEFLKRYPRNRLARQMRGSGLFRAGKLSEARLIYEELLQEYALLNLSTSKNLPLGYYKAAGNLARIYSGLGLKHEASAKLALWQKALDSGLSPWLPATLKRDLERLKKP
jgi:tetratricopeptide (TPR) repeat protein